MGNLISKRKKKRKNGGPKNTVRGPLPVSQEMENMIAAIPATASDSAPAPVHIDAWSDISCPWCYVGKVRLDRAIKNIESASGKKLFTVKWHPYIIDLNTCSVGEEYLAYNVRRWGGDGWTASLRKAGAKDGASFKDWRWWPNSVNAHRLVRFAEEYGKADVAKDLMLRMTYEEGKNVSELDVLCEAAVRLMLPDARAYLESNEGRREVLEEDRLAKECGIRAVPFYIINEKVSCSGARETEAFKDLLQRALNSVKPSKPFHLKD